MSIEKKFAPLLEKRPTATVRTTFTLTEKADTAMSWLLAEQGISFMNIVDLLLSEQASSHSDSTCLNIIREDNGDSIPTVRRTLVLSRSANNLLKQLAVEINITRDQLTSRIIVLAEECVTKLVAERARYRLSAGKKINDWLSQGEEIAEWLPELLGKNDEITIALAWIHKTILQQGTLIKEILEKDKADDIRTLP